MSSMEPSSARFPGQALPPAYFSPGSSFTDFLRLAAPELLPGNRQLSEGVVEAPHGTTIVAVAYKGGVLIAGDRRATMGNLIAQRDIDKLFVTDSYSAVGIAGTAGIALEMVRLFQVELEHYEKLEGVPLSLDGKAPWAPCCAPTRRSHAGAAVVPLPVGFDTDAEDPDHAGHHLHTPRAKRGRRLPCRGPVRSQTALKKRYEPQSDQQTAVRIAIEALDAADDDGYRRSGSTAASTRRSINGGRCVRMPENSGSRHGGRQPPNGEPGG